MCLMVMGLGFSSTIQVSLFVLFIFFLILSFLLLSECLSGCDHLIEYDVLILFQEDLFWGILWHPQIWSFVLDHQILLELAVVIPLSF